jgi:hypothetical protein|tara:strand:+ start:707 stop:907 length:201 start_codon:yes stop_codon:yes gene_type:complete
VYYGTDNFEDFDFHLFLGGIFGMVMGFIKVFGGGNPLEYGILGGIGGFWLLSSAIVIFIQDRVDKA